MENTKKSDFATAGLVLGIIAIVFEIIALIKKAGKGKTIAAIILEILTIAITLNAQKAVSDSLNEVNSNLDKIPGNSTEEILANDADVILGDFEVKNGAYTTDTNLTVKVTNKTSKTKSFQIQIEAIGKDGSRLASDYIYANNLTAGQSQNFETFNFVTSDKISEMKNATFKIVEVSMY